MEKAYEIITRGCIGISFGFSIISLLNQDMSTAIKCATLSAMLYLVLVLRKVINNV